MTGTHVLVDDHGTDPLRWRYRVQDARTRQTWLGSCRTRDEAMACVDAYLRGLWRARDARSRLTRFLAAIPEPQPPSP